LTEEVNKPEKTNTQKSTKTKNEAFISYIKNYAVWWCILHVVVVECGGFEEWIEKCGEDEA
jgi:hypothetical protein